jgi:hypothetical protein
VRLEETCRENCAFGQRGVPYVNFKINNLKSIAQSQLHSYLSIFSQVKKSHAMLK